MGGGSSPVRGSTWDPDVPAPGLRNSPVRAGPECGWTTKNGRFPEPAGGARKATRTERILSRIPLTCQSLQQERVRKCASAIRGRKPPLFPAWTRGKRGRKLGLLRKGPGVESRLHLAALRIARRAAKEAPGPAPVKRCGPKDQRRSGVLRRPGGGISPPATFPIGSRLRPGSGRKRPRGRWVQRNPRAGDRSGRRRCCFRRLRGAGLGPCRLLGRLLLGGFLLLTCDPSYCLLLGRFLT